MLSTSVDPLRNRIVGRCEVEGQDPDEAVVHEVVFFRRPVDDPAVQVCLSDASGAEFPYSDTLAGLTWEQAEMLGELLTSVVAEARSQGWLAS